MGKVYVGDVGTEIVLDCGSDISDATVMEIEVSKPSGATETWTAALEGTNYLKYVVQAGDLDEAGTWKLQASIVTPAWTGLGETAKLKVYEAFK